MKKILVTTLVAFAIVGSALAQGSVTFQASAGTIKYTLDGKLSSAVPVPNGTPPAFAGVVPGMGPVSIALYAATKGTTLSLVGGVPDLSAWQIGTPLATLFPVAGGVPGTTIAIPAALSGASGGNEVQLEVVAWTGSFTDFAAAVKGGALVAWAGDPLSGGSLSWAQKTSTPTTVENLTAGVFNGLVLAPIPEPSTFALAGLGAAALLIFRRRK